MVDNVKTIAFIGLGVMGFPMALNLRKKLGSSDTLLVSDVSETAISQFIKETQGHGPVEVTKNGFEAAQKADMIITMLPGSQAVKAVYLDSQTGILAGITSAIETDEKPRNWTIMECGTIETDTILGVSKAVDSLNASHPKASSPVGFVDAPVSGGPMGAQAGTLTFMVGANNKASFTLVEAVLQHMGSKQGIFLCGDVGAGTAFKVINNYLSAITSLAASEALNIGAKMGLDVKLLTDVINVSGGQCWVTSHSNPVPGVQANVPSSRNYEGGFKIELCRKVLNMGSQLAEMVGARTTLDKPTLAAFDEAIADQRYAGKDARVVYKWLNEST